MNLKQKWLLLICSALSFLPPFCSSAEQPSISRPEKWALHQLRSSLGLRAREWPLRSDPCESWAGIQCSHGQVTGINISGFRRTKKGSLNPQFSVDALGNLTALSSFNASNFALPGPIPDWLGSKLHALQVLDLRSCSISGAIPPTLGNLSSLVQLHLSRNNLTGGIPSSISRLISLNKLDLSQNFLSGKLPGNLFPPMSSLKFLVLNSNGFSGEFPDVLWSMPSLLFVDLSANSFTGLLPNVSSRVDNNNNSNGSSSVFNISRNLFYGNITPVIKGFSFVDISENYLEGPIPDYVRGPTLLGNNCLRNSSSQRNMSECVLFYAGKDLVFDNFGEVPNASSSQPLSPINERNPRLVLILGPVFGGLGLLILVIVLVTICIRRRGRNNTNQSGGGGVNAGPTPETGGGPLLDFSKLGEAFTYQQILQATGEFNSGNLLIKGHSGDLFRAVVEDGVEVVVKKINLSSSVKKDAYMFELDVFSKSSWHPRLVPLLGHCLENEDEKFLVYRHMVNGDLSNTLYRKRNISDDRLQSLDWITRLKIAIGAAEGLCYLHHECNPPLVHRDVQASSILLDDKFEVRLGSLSEVCPQESDIHQNRITRLLRFPQSSDQAASGTHNAFCAYDVYCFGKVLLELVTGNLGISSSSDSTAKGWLDATLLHISISDKELVNNIVDPTLIIDEDLLEEVWAVAVVARSCLNPKASRRPLMRYVLKALENPLKVVRDEQFTGSERFRTSSSRGSWNAALVESWRRSSSDVAAVGRAGEGPSGEKRSGAGL